METSSHLMIVNPISLDLQDQENLLFLSELLELVKRHARKQSFKNLNSRDLLEFCHLEDINILLAAHQELLFARTPEERSQIFAKTSLKTCKITASQFINSLNISLSITK